MAACPRPGWGLVIVGYVLNAESCTKFDTARKRASVPVPSMCAVAVSCADSYAENSHSRIYWIDLCLHRFVFRVCGRLPSAVGGSEIETVLLRIVRRFAPDLDAIAVVVSV